HREVLRAAAVGVTEGIPDAVDLVRAGAAHHLERRLPEAEHARGTDRVGAQDAARRVHRQMAAHLLVAALDDLPALGRVAAAEVLEPHRLEPGEGDGQLAGLDLRPTCVYCAAVVPRTGTAPPRPP